VISTVASSKNHRVIFRHDGPILALQMVKLSSLHVEGRLDDALHQLHLIELVIALRMGVSLSIFGVHSHLSLRVSPVWRE
jgi:hypothetical protein